MVRQNQITRKSPAVAFMLLLFTVWTRQKQENHHQQFVFVIAFTVILNHHKIVTRKPSPGILALQRQHRRQEDVALRRRRHITFTAIATQLGMNQQGDQNENEDESPLFYNDFDGFTSDDIYLAREIDKSKAVDNGTEVDESDDDDDSENDSIVDDDALGDWRSFRRKLATQERQQKMPFASTTSSYTVFDNSNKTEVGLGLNNNSIFSSTTSSDDSIEQGEEHPQKSSQRPSSLNNKKATTTTLKKTKSPNEILFEQQNDKLAQEYYQDTWAHEIATVRVTFALFYFNFAIRTRNHSC